MTTCPTVNFEWKQQEDNVSKLLKSLGITSCHTTDTTETYRKKASVLGITVSDTTVTKEYSSSLGCEDLFLLSDKYRQSVQNVSCIISSRKSNVEIQLYTGNSINISATNDLNATCDLNITQDIGTKILKISSVVSDEEINQISEECKNLQKEIVNVIQKSVGKNAKINASETARQITTSIEQIKNYNYSSIVSQSLNSVNVTLNTKNDIFISADDINISADQCTITQTIIADIMATVVIQNAMSSAFLNVAEIMRAWDNENNIPDPDFSEIKTPVDKYADLKRIIYISVISLAVLIVLILLINLAFYKFKK